MSEFTSILNDIGQRKFEKIYFLHGEEPYFIDQIVQKIEQSALPEAERSFNQSVLYGKEIDFKQVLDNARMYPMMSEYRVVIVKEFQAMRNIENLQGYFENPAEKTVLVLAHKHKKIDKPKEKAMECHQKQLFSIRV